MISGVQKQGAFDPNALQSQLSFHHAHPFIKRIKVQTTSINGFPASGAFKYPNEVRS